ncbi:uncharacterized protein DS421_9g271920 [Arachis hypogaea]|nr:uncharacterized protein DS421_9g271920 [Arachis hypogaea]
MRGLTIKILSLTCSASGCERSWSIFDHERMESLVFIKYNQQLIEKYNLKDEVGPIALNDIDECNEWLVGEIRTATFRDDDNVDDDADLVHQDDNTLSWNLVFEVMGDMNLPQILGEDNKIEKEKNLQLQGVVQRVDQMGLSFKKRKRKGSNCGRGRRIRS